MNYWNIAAPDCQIANSKTWATWTHSYGNKLGWLAQGMPGRVTGMDTIFFIPKDKVPRARAKDVTYGLITCLKSQRKLMSQTEQD